MTKAPKDWRTRAPDERKSPILTVAVLQQKGGSGKTTLAINLATAAHLDGDHALVVDMDRQASVFDWSAARRDGSPPDGLAATLADALSSTSLARRVYPGRPVRSCGASGA